MIESNEVHPLYNEIKNEYLSLCASEYSAQDLDFLISKNLDVPVKLAAIGFVYIELYPSLCRGYLTAYDSLHSLGFDGLSLDIINQYRVENSWHPLVISRLIRRLCSHYDFKATYDLLISMPKECHVDFIAVPDMVSYINKICLFFKCNILLDKFNVKPNDVLKKEINDYNIFIEENRHSTLADLELMVNEGKYLDAEMLFIFLEKKGGRGRDFYEKATEPMPNELDISPRVRYFRLEAGKKYIEPSFILKMAYSYMYSDEVQLALNNIRKTLYIGQISDDLLRLAFKVFSLKNIDIEMALGLAIQSHSDVRLETITFIITSLYHRKLREGNLLDASVFLSSFKKYVDEKSFYIKGKSSLNMRCLDEIQVGVCISGQMRGVQDNAKNIHSCFKKVNNVDYVIDTWDQGSFANIRFNRVNRFIGQELYNLLPVELRMPVGFGKALPKATARLIQPMLYKVDKDFLIKYFPNAFFNIDNESEFEFKALKHFNNLKHRGNLNQAKMYYKIYKANELLSAAEEIKNKKYDVIVRIRPDLNIVIDNIANYINAAYRNENIIFINYSTAVGFGDQFAIGSRKAMNIYSSVWKIVSESNNFTYSQLFDANVNKFVGEALLANHLLYQGLRVIIIRPSAVRLVDPLAINVIGDISKELATDIETSNFKEELNDFMSHYHDMLFNKELFK